MTDLKEQNFGIEIELTGITRAQAAQTVAEYFGTGYRHTGGAYDAWEADDREGRAWKLQRDASILAQRKAADGSVTAATEAYQTEAVSPILRYADIGDLQGIVRALRKRGAIANSSAGIHVHIDAARHTPQSLRNLVNIIGSKEDILYKALDISPDREHYCSKTNAGMVELINKKKPETMQQLADIWYSTQAPLESRSRHYNRSRYHGLNLHAVFTHGTVEFRLFNSTTHAGKVKAYIQFCLAVSAQALNQTKASARKTHSDNEKYAFRCWLLRLGLIGDEYRTCRLHLLGHLEGNSAWRHGAAA